MARFGTCARVKRVRRAAANGTCTLATETPAESGTPPEEQDFIFRAQVAATELFLGYWHYGLYAIGGVLAISFAVGYYGDYRQEQAELQYGAIAAVDHKMPVVEGLALYGIGPKDDPTDLQRKATLAEGARRFAEAAAKNSGSAAVYGWLKAAEAHERAQEPAEAKAAVESAMKVGAGGMAGFVADSAWVGVLVGDKRNDEALALLRTMSDKNSDLLAEESLLRLAELQLSLDKKTEAKATLEELNKRFPTPSRAEEVASLAARIGSSG